jgi:hypothetical protein
MEEKQRIQQFQEELKLKKYTIYKTKKPFPKDVGKNFSLAFINSRNQLEFEESSFIRMDKQTTRFNPKAKSVEYKRILIAWKLI